MRKSTRCVSSPLTNPSIRFVIEETTLQKQLVRAGWGLLCGVVQKKKILPARTSSCFCSVVASITKRNGGFVREKLTYLLDFLTVVDAGPFTTAEEDPRTCNLRPASSRGQPWHSMHRALHGLPDRH